MNDGSQLEAAEGMRNALGRGQGDRAAAMAPEMEAGAELGIGQADGDLFIVPAAKRQDDAFGPEEAGESLGQGEEIVLEGVAGDGAGLVIGDQLAPGADIEIGEVGLARRILPRDLDAAPDKGNFPGGERFGSHLDAFALKGDEFVGNGAAMAELVDDLGGGPAQDPAGIGPGAAEVNGAGRV